MLPDISMDAQALHVISQNPGPLFVRECHRPAPPLSLWVLFTAGTGSGGRHYAGGDLRLPEGHILSYGTVRLSSFPSLFMLEVGTYRSDTHPSRYLIGVNLYNRLGESSVRKRPASMGDRKRMSPRQLLCIASQLRYVNVPAATTCIVR